MSLFSRIQQLGGSLANSLANQNVAPNFEAIQLDYDGNIDPVASAKLEMQTAPRTLGEKMFGKADERNIMQADPETGEAKLATITSYQPGLINDLSRGYADNYNNGFNFNNFRNDDNKNWTNRLGEGLGTVGRFIDSPLGRGLIAAGLNKALGYDNSLQEGLTAFAGRQNAVTADKLYRRQLKDYGYTDDDLAQIRGNITTDMYKNLATNLYRNKKITQDQAVKNINLIRQMQAANQIDNATASALMANVMQNTDFGDVGNINFQDSNQTRNTNSQIEYRSERLKQYDKQLELIDKRIAQTGANTQARISLEKQKLDIKQKIKEQEKLDKQEKAQDLAEFQQILGGKDKGAKDYARNSYIRKYGEDPLKKLELY